MLYSNTYSVVDSWAFIDFSLSFSFTACSKFPIIVTLLFSFISLLALVYYTSSVLEVIFWAELLLVTSIFGIVFVTSSYGMSSGVAHAILLLTATAVEAAIGMMLVLETSGRGVSQQFRDLNRLAG